MNNDTKKQLKKWGKPVIDVQWFLAQEYCVNCYTGDFRNSTLHSQYPVVYLDLNSDITHQTNERFYNGGNKNNLDGGPMTVDFYYLTGNGVYDGGSFSSTLNGKSYNGTYTAYNKTLKFVKINSYTIKLINHQIFFKEGNAS